MDGRTEMDGESWRTRGKTTSVPVLVSSTREYTAPPPPATTPAPCTAASPLKKKKKKSEQGARCPPDSLGRGRARARELGKGSPTPTSTYDGLARRVRAVAGRRPLLAGRARPGVANERRVRNSWITWLANPTRAGLARAPRQTRTWRNRIGTHTHRPRRRPCHPRPHLQLGASLARSSCLFSHKVAARALALHAPAHMDQW